MSEKERKIGETISAAIVDLPDDNLEHFLIFAEGVAAGVSLARAGMADA